MKKLSVLLVSVCLVFGIVFGCAQYQQYTSWVRDTNNVPSECQDSIVYNHIPMADLTKGILQVTAQFVSANEGYRRWGISLHKKAIELAKDPNMTNAKFATKLIEEAKLINEYWGQTLVAVQDALRMFLKVRPLELMNECDRAYIIDLSTTRISVLESGLDLQSFLPGCFGSDSQCVMLSSLSAGSGRDS